MRDLSGKSIGVLGLSTEGIDTVKFLAMKGAKIVCCDRRTEPELTETYQFLSKYPVSFNLGETYLANLASFDLLVRTPGMSPRLPELVSFHKTGKEITSLTKLFFEFCPAPIIGVTGTKGKGTTSTLISEMLKASGKTVYLGGNVGTPLLSQIEKIKPSDLVVLELSSFQLEDLTQSPQTAVVLRTTQEHLANFDKLASNYHPTVKAYVQAKQSIVSYQKESDYAILNADDPTSMSFADLTPGQKVYFSLNGKTVDAYVQDETVYLKQGQQSTKICSLEEIKLRGRHNLENIAAASLASLHHGADIDTIRMVVRQFSSLPHRLEFVKSVNGVDYYDDSFSTVPETTIAAINSFHQPIILILGGSEKGSDFQEMGKAIAKSNVKAVIVIGQMTQRITSALKSANYQGKLILDCKTMPEIMAQAKNLVQPGDVVLLSPACASFDMFANYKDRGDQFKNEV